jgi:hypothetical protein
MDGSEKLRVVGETVHDGNITFEDSTSAPTVGQQARSSWAGETLTVIGQSTTDGGVTAGGVSIIAGDTSVGASSAGGDILIQSGSALSGFGSESGTILNRIGSGTDNAGRFVIQDAPSTLLLQIGGSVPGLNLNVNRLFWSAGVSSPQITQTENTAPSTISTKLVIEAQNGVADDVTGGGLDLLGGSAVGSSGTKTGGSVLVEGGAASGVGTNVGGSVAIDGGSGATAGDVNIGTTNAANVNICSASTDLGFFGVSAAPRAAAYTRAAVVVESRALLANASATAANNNAVLAALIADLQAYGLLA